MVMAVSGENETPRGFQQAVFRQYREIQHHLIHLGLAVSPNTENAVLYGIQQGDHLLGGIALRQVVPGAVV